MLKNPRFESVYESLSKPIFRFIAKRLGTKPQLTEEVFEETMVAAWKGFETFKHKSSYFTWICRIALNKIADYYRGQVNERSKLIAPLLEDLAYVDDDNISPDEKVALDDLRLSIRNILNLLPDKKRNLLYLRYWEELTVKQIAKQMNLSERAIEGKIYRAKQILRRLIEEKDPETAKEYTKK